MGIHLMKIAVTLTLIGLVGFSFCSVVGSTPDKNVISLLCNGGLYTAGDPFSVSLGTCQNAMDGQQFLLVVQ
ncbi:hypothetical protein C1H46_015110 [Malus baccata]|uniref:Uncharacterized protein n=1 Tax=Malus baccata TaxID=106549 RepID=A0A540MKK5_MALBA|nr:hypothetical protein C1H46_015110 [Malus baccata]